MIKINLVPLKEKKKQQEYVLIVTGIVAAGFLVFVMFWIYIQKVQTERDLNVQIKKIDAESQGYQEKIAEVNAFQDSEQKLDDTNKTIEGIETIQRNVMFVFDQIAIDLPPGVWLTSVSQQTAKNKSGYLVEGRALSFGDVQQYYEALIHTDGLDKNATLDITGGSSSPTENTKVIQFSITTNIAGEKS